MCHVEYFRSFDSKHVVIMIGFVLTALAAERLR
jgi:hypothetical protein